MSDMDRYKQASGVGRDILEQRVRVLCDIVAECRRDNATMLENLTATQARCTAFKERVESLLARAATAEARVKELEGGIVLPGWRCTAVVGEGVICECFNGSEKETLTHCRSCGALRGVSSS